MQSAQIAGDRGSSDRDEGRSVPRYAFSLIGGEHQFWHAAPVAAALSQMTEDRVVCFVTDPQDKSKLEEMFVALGSGPIEIIDMALPRPLLRLLALGRPRGRQPLKIVRLAWWSRAMRQSDVIVAVERTSVLLKKLGRKGPPMVHIPHGAGDRARGYDRRIRHFDHVFAAGPKDSERFIQYGLARPEQISVTGYIKRSGLQKVFKEKPIFFNNNKPTILYNPHFSKSLSSWFEQGKEIISTVASTDRFNLIFAPHVRLFENASPSERAEIEALARPGSVHIDLGSPRSIDMSYTLAADLYLGDVSSQVYEFCAQPRPCVFVNAHGVSWKGDPHYAMWHFGEVVEKIDGLVSALDGASQVHATYEAVQREAVEWSFGDSGVDAAQVAAARLIEIADGWRH